MGLKRKSKNRGYTLVELLVVLVILGIITVLAVPAIMKLTGNQTNEKYRYQEKMVKEATDLYVDRYKRGLSNEYSCFNITYQTLISEGLLKEEDLTCTGIVQATRKKGNNFTYNYYLECKEKSGKVIKKSEPVPDGCVGIYGKFMIDYVIKYKNESGAKYNYQWTNQALYQKYSATDLSKVSSTGNAGIKEFQYSKDKRQWTSIPATTSGIGSWTIQSNHSGKIYFRAIDSDGNESEILAYTLKIDVVAPTFTKLLIKPTNSEYNDPNVKLEMSANDDLSKNLTMCISNTGYEQGCSWEKYVDTKSWRLLGGLDGIGKKVFVTVKDAAGNQTRRPQDLIDPYVPYKECSQVKNEISGYGSCSKTCDGGVQYQVLKQYDKNTNKLCKQDNQYNPRACNTQPCENPDDYEWSKVQACDRNKFQAIANNTPKFKNFIEKQAFRNAMYDCSQVTASILENTESAWQALKQSSRYSLVSGSGRSTSCKCYYNKTSNSAEKTCRKPACDYEYQNFVSGTIYGGKVFVMRASAMNSLSGTYDDNGFGDYEDTGRTWDKWGYTRFLMGSGNDISEVGAWGSCTKTNTGDINYNICSSRDEQRSRLSIFLPSLRVGLYRYANYTYDADSNDRDLHYYYNGTVYVQIFRI